MSIHIITTDCKRNDKKAKIYRQEKGTDGSEAEEIICEKEIIDLRILPWYCSELNILISYSSFHCGIDFGILMR